MIKVLHVISDTNIGGAGILLCNLLVSADRTRFDTVAVTPRGSLLVPKIQGLGVRVIEIDRGADHSADLLAVPALCHILRAEKPHILHTHSALYARLAGLFCRVPVSVNTRHCADANARTSLPLRLTAGGLERTLGSHTIATANYVKDVLAARGVPKERIHIIHNGSHPLPVIPEEQKSAVRRELGLADSDFAVGMVARLAEGKGHDTFLRAAKLCLQKAPHFRFLIVGDGDQATALRKLAQDLGISHRVIFTGFRADVAPIMNILHLNVNCSEHSETSSLSLSEGMSVGTVPVVSNCGGNAYMAGFGENGAVFPIGDAKALSDIILSLERDRPHLALLSQKCRARFYEHFTAKAMTKQVESLYEQLLKDKF